VLSFRLSIRHARCDGIARALHLVHVHVRPTRARARVVPGLSRETFVLSDLRKAEPPDRGVAFLILIEN